MNSPSSTIRVARDDDAKAIHTIYAPFVSESAVTFETELPTIADMRERMRSKLRDYPWLVWDKGGAVLAYAYAGRFRERAAYDWIAETSIYVHADARRRGIARQLYGFLLDTLRHQGVTQAVGVITLPSDGSVDLHEALGFTPAGVWRQAGYKLGHWWDVGVWQKTLQASPTSPAPITPFSALATDYPVQL